MSHLDDARIAAWLAGEDPAAEEHLFACGECAAHAERVMRITEAVRRMLPLVVDAAGLVGLRARGLRVHENPCAPDVVSTAVFGVDDDVLLHRLEGLALDDALRVDLKVSIISSGEHVTTARGVPFERGSGMIMIVCQRHFSAWPPDTLMQVHVHAPAGETITRYPILHVFDVRSG